MISKVELRNWKSYMEEEFEFGEGVNALIGDMGSGKSSVLEAIVFGLFGKLPAVQERRIGLESLIRRLPNREDEASVKVFFKAGSQYSVERVVDRDRGTKKSMLRKEGEVVAGPQAKEVTEKVEEIIGLDFDMFTTIIYSEQNALDFFLSLRPSERKEKIDRLLKIDKFEDARSSLVTLKNRVKSKRKTRENDLREMKEGFDSSEVEEVAGKIKDLREGIENKQKEAKELEERKKKVSERLSEIKDKKEKIEKLEKSRTKLETRFETLEERIEGKNVSIKPQDSLGKVEEEIEEAEEEVERIEGLDKQVSDVKKEKKVVERDLKELKKEISSLEEKKKRLKKLDGVKKSINNKEESLESVKERISELNAEKGMLEESIEKLSKSSESCPVCGKPLDEEHRVKRLKKSKKKISEISDEKKELFNKKKKIEEGLKELKEQRNNLLKLGEVGEKIREKKEEVETGKEKIGNLKEKISELEEKLEEKNREEVENKIEQLEEKKAVFELKEKKNKFSKKLGDLQEELSELDYDDDLFESLQEEFNSVKTDFKVIRNEIGSKKELVEEKEKRLDELKEKKKRLENLSDEVDKYRMLEDFFSSFRKSLLTTQEKMRERFVKKLNDIMKEIWDRVYPYEDYSSIKIGVEGDYVLKVRDSRGNWIPVEGEVSGGERHSSALTLRLALSVVLGDGFGVLMLDEPTHNLDERTIQDLSSTLREDVSGLVEQLILITHEPGLEDAVTSYLYNVDKDDSVGITTKEEVYLPGG